MNYELFFQHYIASHPHTVAGSLTILAARRWSDWKKYIYIYIFCTDFEGFVWLC